MTTYSPPPNHSDLLYALYLIAQSMFFLAVFALALLVAISL